MLEYLIGQAATAVFSITGVLGARSKDRDIFGLVVLGIITALGGGTVRDMVLDVEIFWIGDFTYGWVALFAAMATFWVPRVFTNTYRLLLYLDAVGAALFGIYAINKTLALGHPAPVAVIMGVLTGIGGGILRDVLAGRPNLLLRKELYATPILMGAILYTALLHFSGSHPINKIVGIAAIFGLRAAAIHWDLPRTAPNPEAGC